jgi:hypothetical protein
MHRSAALRPVEHASGGVCCAWSGGAETKACVQAGASASSTRPRRPTARLCTARCGSGLHRASPSASTRRATWRWPSRRTSSPRRRPRRRPTQSLAAGSPRWRSCLRRQRPRAQRLRELRLRTPAAPSAPAAVRSPPWRGFLRGLPRSSAADGPILCMRADWFARTSIIEWCMQAPWVYTSRA